MKKIIIASVLAILALPVFAQTTTGTGTGTANAGASGGSVSFAPVTNSSSKVDYAAASAVAPGLTAGFKTCMGSSSSGVQGLQFGVALGSTWKDEDCQAGEFGQQLWNQGYKAAAIGVLCSRDVIRYAIAVTGGIPYRRNDGAVVKRACPMTQDEWKKAGQPLLDPISGQPYTDAELNPPPAPNPLASAVNAKAAVIQAKADALQQALDASQPTSAAKLVSAK